MTEHELLRIIAFLERVRQPFQELVPIAEEDATWNLLLFLIKNHLTGTPVAISTLPRSRRLRMRPQCGASMP